MTPTRVLRPAAIACLLAVFTVGLLCSPASAQEFNKHKFWDTQNTSAFVITAGIRAADAAYTCSMMSTPGFRERWLPVKSCAGVSTWLAATQGTQLAATYFVHRSGHHKWERTLPYVWVAPSAIGIGYTIGHSR